MVAAKRGLTMPGVPAQSETPGTEAMVIMTVWFTTIPLMPLLTTIALIPLLTPIVVTPIVMIPKVMPEVLPEVLSVIVL